jgi:hypothetical protein
MIENADAIVQWAMEIADSVPERYQLATFSELLRFALRSQPENKLDHPIASEPSSQPAVVSEKALTGVPDPFLVAENGSREQQIVWAVIQLCEEAEEATTNTVMNLIQNRLSISSPARANTSRMLGELTPKYLTRKKEGRGFVYRPTSRATEIFEGIHNES